MKRNIGRFLMIGVMVALSGSFIYCGGGGGGNGGEEGTTSGTGAGPADLPGEASAFIEADQGGSVVAGDGTTLEIPPDALPQDTTVKVVPVRVDHLGTEYMVGVRFEPDGLVLAKPATCFLALPAYWDRDERPSVCAFQGKDPAGATCSGLYVDIEGSPGAYKAKIEVLHFSGYTASGKPAANCHEGTLEYLLKKFAARRCHRNQALNRVIQDFKDKYGKNLQFPWGTASGDWETPTQAFLDTYFEELPVFGPLDQKFLDDLQQKYLNPSVAEGYRYEVVLAFGGKDA